MLHAIFYLSHTPLRTKNLLDDTARLFWIRPFLTRTERQIPDGKGRKTVRVKVSIGVVNTPGFGSNNEITYNSLLKSIACSFITNRRSQSYFNPNTVVM